MKIAMETYPLRVQNLPKDITRSDVSDFFDSPHKDILRHIEIISNDSTSTAILVLTRPDVAYDFMNLKEPVIAGNRVTIVPELFEETSITLNRYWLREIDDENPTVQINIKTLAKAFDLKLDVRATSPRNTISLTGVPWRIKQAKASLTDKIQALIKNRSRRVQKHLDLKHSHLSGADVLSVVNKSVDQSTYVDGMPAANEQRNSGNLEDLQKSGDARLYMDMKSSTESGNANPGKKRQRILKTDESKSPTPHDDVAIKCSNQMDEDQPKESKPRTRVLKQKTEEETQKPVSSASATGESSPVNYPGSTQHQAVVRIDIDIHRYLLEHSKQLDFADSSITQFQVSEQHIDWVIGNNNEKDLLDDENVLKEIIRKVHIECYAIPGGFEVEVFKDLIETSNQNKNVTLVFSLNQRNCKVVGPKDDVKSTLKWIGVTVNDNFKRSKQKQCKVSKTDRSDDSRRYDLRSGDNKLEVQQSGSQRHSPDYKADISDTGNKIGRFPNPKQQLTKVGDGIRISQTPKDRLEFTTRGNLRVSVYQGNMIKQPTEVIVNPANEHLAHGGGLARVILNAGGPVIDDESRMIISKQGKLQTSEVVHTSAGNLPPPIKYVLHAVGPTAYEFKDNKAGLVSTLKVTFRNCLVYANDKLSVSSISLPAISSGIFAVPMPDIVQGALEAIQDFDRMNSTTVLKEVHFISNDAKTTEEMISHFLKIIKGDERF